MTDSPLFPRRCDDCTRKMERPGPPAADPFLAELRRRVQEESLLDVLHAASLEGELEELVRYCQSEEQA